MATTSLPASAPTIKPPSYLGGRRWVEWAFIFGFWTLLATLTAIHRGLDPRLIAGLYVPDGEMWRVLLRPYTSLYAWALITPLLFAFSRRFPIERETWKVRLVQHLGFALLVSSAVDLYDDFVRSTLLQPLGSWPFEPLTDFVRLGFLNELTIYFTVLAAGMARDYFFRFKSRQEAMAELVEQSARLETQLSEARLQALRMQVNPHFLFNTLHAVSSLVERDPKGVRRMIARLSSLLRYTMEGTSAQEVPLHQELEFLEGYLEIQQIRFQGRLDVNEEIAEDARHALVPNLILQPLVENAIKHGISKLEGVGRLEIYAQRDGSDLLLGVRDNGPGLFAEGDGAPANPRIGVGLRNTRERLQALYGDGYDLDLRAGARQGVVAEIRVPFHTANDLVLAVEADAAHG